MCRWIAWTATLLAGALCFYPGLRMLWFGPWGTGQMIQPGTAISVRLLQPLTSANAQPGQSFAAYVVAAEAVKGSAPVLPGTLVEGTCLAVRRAAGDSRPGYIRLVLQGLRDSEGRFTPLETTTFSEWGGPDRGRGRAAGNGERAGSRLTWRPMEGNCSSNQLLASVDALLPTEENIKFVVLKPSLIPPGFSLP
jgi:hypothetical protein